MKPILRISLLMSLILLVWGCGGGSNMPGLTGSSTQDSGRATLTVEWPERTRLIPAASNSIRVEMRKGETVVAATVLARPAGDGPATAVFESLPTGELTVTATAYPNADGTGTAQATATTTLTIQSGQTTQFALTLVSTIDHLEVAASPIDVGVGARRFVGVTAKNAAGAIVLVATGKITYRSSNTSLVTVNSSGVATGAAPGNAQITVTDTESGKSVVVAVVVRAQTTIAFAAPVSYAVPAAGDQVIAADFDGDGNADVAIGGQTQLGILYGNGDGTLQPFTNVLTHDATIGARAAADVNGDGRTDLIATDSNSRLVVLLNNGGRTFSAPVITSIGAQVTFVAAGDFNNDGAPDLAIAAPQIGRVVIAFNQGNGAFGNLVAYPVGIEPRSIVAADINSDRIKDIVVGYTGGIKTLIGRGDGRFTDAPSFATANGGAGPIVTDFNGDGKVDMAVTNEINNSVSIVTGNGTGTFTPATIYPVDLSPLIAKGADFDRNGAPDILTSNAGATVFTILQNRGLGTFIGARKFASGGGDTRSVDVADFNKDGKPDVVAQNQASNTVSIMLNTTQ